LLYSSASRITASWSKMLVFSNLPCTYHDKHACTKHIRRNVTHMSLSDALHRRTYIDSNMIAHTYIGANNIAHIHVSTHLSM
jgi:hypothetical protein